MDGCLTDQHLAAFVDGSASPEQMSAWNEHIDACPSCAGRVADHHAKHSGSGPSPGSRSSEGFPPGTVLGDFRIERRLGAGGMGIVFQARQLSLNRRVALKVLPPGLGMTPTAVVRFRREAQAAAKLHHTNIVAVYAEGEHHGTCFYAMELIAGQTLGQVIAELRTSSDRTSPIPSDDDTVTVPSVRPPRDTTATPSTTRTATLGSGSHRDHFDTIAAWVADAADALDYAHKQGVIHRDIKPSNLMLDHERRLKLMDFGLARMLEEPGMTITGEFLGTPRYMSPEQIAAGRAKVDYRTDIYSLGATLYELLTLAPPFPGDHRDEIIAAIMTKEPRPPRQIDRHIPRDLETICLKAIEKDPDRRYESGAALAADLRRYRDRDAISARRAGLVHRTSKFARRHKVPATAVISIALAVSIAATLAWKYWPEPPVPPPPPPTRLVLTPPRQVTRDAGLTTEPALSPDGTILAYASDRAGKGDLDIWLQPLDGGTPRPLTQHEADDHEPAFSPDGTTIAYRSEREGGGIYVIPVEGGEPTRLARLGRRPRFSPDGRHVAYWVGHIGGWWNGKLYVVSSRGGKPTPLQPHFAMAQYPVWSPDGSHLLFAGGGTAKPTSPPDELHFDWWVAPLDGGPAIGTGAVDAFARHGIAGRPAPGAWLADGNRVLFAGSAGDSANLWAVAIDPESLTITGEPQRLTSMTGRGLHPLAAAGGRVVFASVRANLDIWSIAIDADEGKLAPGAQLERLTEHPAGDTRPVISRDGKTLAFASYRSGNYDVWLENLGSGGQPVPLTATPERELYPALTADGFKVAWWVYPVGAERGQIRVRRVAEQVAETICADCNTVWAWTADGKGLLVRVAPESSGISVLDVASGEQAPLVRSDEYHMFQARSSPDGRWLSFNAYREPSHSELFVAPYRPGEPATESEWIPVSDIPAWDDKPRWSPDGSLLYFTSDRDGFRCIWARRLDPETKRPVGPPFAVYHSHSARRSLLNVGLASLEIDVARDKLVFVLGERTGNIWTAELTEE